MVPHSKLFEYGIVSSNRSSNIKDRLDFLGLTEGEDYNLRDISQVRKERGCVTKKVYNLTPEAFKKCLMRAQRRPNQTVDPVIYCDYYLLLEKMHKLYTEYEKSIMETPIILNGAEFRTFRDGKVGNINFDALDENEKVDYVKKIM